MKEHSKSITESRINYDRKFGKNYNRDEDRGRYIYFFKKEENCCSKLAFFKRRIKTYQRTFMNVENLQIEKSEHKKFYGILDKPAFYIL